MKKMLLATALALLITGCAQQTCLLFKCPAAVAPKETITHHFFVSELGRRKTVDAAKFVAAQKMLGTETQQTFVNGLLGFITLGIYTPLEARAANVYTIRLTLPIDMGNSILQLPINILLGLPVVFA